MSAQNISLLTLSLVAAGTLVADRFVTPAGVQSGLAGDALGVAECAAVAADIVPVTVAGTAVVEAGAAIAVGARVQSDASGRAITAAASGIKKAVIAGGSAGALTVTGIATTDRLVAVIVLDRNATAANITLADLTSEFTITAANTIDNTAGTATTGDALLVIYETVPPVRGRALQAASASGEKIEVLLFQQ